jgi:hypothetical protein
MMPGNGPISSTPVADVFEDAAAPASNKATLAPRTVHRAIHLIVRLLPLLFLLGV